MFLCGCKRQTQKVSEHRTKKTGHSKLLRSLESCLDSPASIKPSSLLSCPVLSGAQASRPRRDQISRGYDPRWFVWHGAGAPDSYFWPVFSSFYSLHWSPLRAQANLLSSTWMPDSGERLMENHPKLDRIYNKTISLLGGIRKTKVNQREIPVTPRFCGRATTEFGPSRTCAGPSWPWRWSLFALLILTLLYADHLKM